MDGGNSIIRSNAGGSGGGGMAAGDTSEETMTITPLGGGQEVGRSCILLQYKNRKVLLDCGCHPGREGHESLPFFDLLDNPKDIDLILITHFHIDHCAALPYFTERTNFQGKIYMTHATKAVMKLLLSDNIRLQNRSNALYNEQDLQNCIDKIEVVDYHQTVEHKGIKFTATAAGHVLGAAMFTIDIDNIRVLYTGDYSMEEDRHLSKAELPPGGPPDVLIVESTFGSTEIAPRDQREALFTSTVESIVSRGGSCLIPVFALGRAQELLLILDEYWKENPHLQSVPVYYAPKLATKSLRVYQTFVNMMNQHVRSLSDHFMNPFKFKHIKSIQNSDFELFGPSVVMASPGFLQSGMSRQLFEAWCEDEKHGVIIPGYTVEGTLADQLKNAPKEITCLDNRIKQRKCQIEFVTFSAHVDCVQNLQFVRSVLPDYIVLVHGEKTQMRRFRDKIEHEVKNNWPTQGGVHIATPENSDNVKFTFLKSVMASVVGDAASNLLRSVESKDAVMTLKGTNQEVVSLPKNAILVTENFASKLVSAEDISKHSNCRFGQITEKFTIPIPGDVLLLFSKSKDTMVAEILKVVADYLQDVLEDVVLEDHNHVVIVQNFINIQFCENMTMTSSGREEKQLLSGLNVTWNASPLADMVADSVAGLLMQFFSATQLVRMTINANKNSEKIHRKKSRTSTSSSQQQLHMMKAREEMKSADDVMLDRLQSAGVDPSRKIPMEFIQEDTSSKLNILREMMMRSPLAGYFASVSLNADHTKLIFRGHPNTSYMTVKGSTGEIEGILTSPTNMQGNGLEGYCFISFGNEQGEQVPLNTAVVQSDNEGFKNCIIYALNRIG